MNIEDIENNFNQFDPSQNEVLSALLNTAIRNQALLQTIFEMQINTMHYLMPEIEFEQLEKEANDSFESKLSAYQAKIASRFSKG